MSRNTDKDFAEKLLKQAGVEINGMREFDLQVNDERFYGRVLTGGSLAMGESYMDSWWEVPLLDEFFTKILSADLERKIKVNLHDLGFLLKSFLVNLQSRQRAFQVGEHHYDLGNDLYETMLGKTMAYSCGYWREAGNLDEAQKAKFDLIGRKMNLRKGMKVLEIGSGWGGLAIYMAEKYGVEVLGVTVSREQLTWSKERAKGLPVKFELMDYRQLKGGFDAIVSVGMFEHVGVKNYRKFFRVVDGLLKERGVFLLHTIGAARTLKTFDPWMHKYIFPNAYLPSVMQIAKASDSLLVMEDWHNFGVDYDKTLMAWWENFDSAWPGLKSRYDERFYRMWKYYLLACAATFRARKNQLWQIVFSKGGVLGGYNSVR